MSYDELLAQVYAALPQKKEAIVNLIGMALLFGLMILLVFKDVWTLMGH